MYVCLCLGVTDRQIRNCIAEGACTEGEIAARTGAGTRCGSCRSSVAALACGSEAEGPSTHRSLPVSRSNAA